MHYPGLFNSSYVPSPAEILIINTPQNHLGPLLIGQISTTLLQGVFFVQYYEYVAGSNDQKRWNRWLVHATACLSLLKLAYVWLLTWDLLVSHYGNWAYLTIFNPLAIPTSLLNTIPTAICQVFYIHRGWVLSKNKYFVGPALLFVILFIASGIAVTWSSISIVGNRAAVSKFGLVSANASIITGLLCNIFITGFLCWYLIKEMTGTRKTDNLVKKVVRISIESATGPTLATLLGLILANRSKNNVWFLFPALATSHVYGCSLLYCVNSRKRLNGMMRNTLCITSNLYRPTEPEAPPNQVIVIEGANNIQPASAGNQVRLTGNALQLETEEMKTGSSPQSTTDGSLQADKDKQVLEVHPST